MKRLQALVKLHDWQLNESRRRVVDLEQLALRFQDEIEAVDAEIARERHAAGGSLQGLGAFSAYLGEARERRGNLERSLAQVQREAEEAREAVRTAFQELKKYELALAARRRRLEEESQRRDTAALDEIGLEVYRRATSRDT